MLSAADHPPANMTTDELRAFVQASSWKFAKSMPQTPHEYTLRREAKNEDLFESVVIHIRQVGYHQKWGKTTYTYLDIDGWQYWTMGAPLEATILINRANLRGKLPENGSAAPKMERTKPTSGVQKLGQNLGKESWGI